MRAAKGFRCVLPVVLLLATLVSIATGQDRAPESRRPVEHIPDTKLRNPVYDIGGDFVLTPFRAYDHIAQQRSDSIVLVNRMRMDVDLPMDEDAQRRMLADPRLAVFQWELTRDRPGEPLGLSGMLVRILMQQALQFGYEYARERVRAGSLSEMDYLYLPQGPGVTRTFDEVGFEARFRGVMQSTRIWQDFEEARKNRIHEDRIKR